MHFWLSSGPAENWEVSIREGGIWAVEDKPTLLTRWQKMQIGDFIVFYVSAPVSGIVGFGTITEKFKDERTLIWPWEKKYNKVRWPYRFRFNVTHVLPKQEWQENKIPISALRINRGSGLNHIVTKDAIIALLQRIDVEWKFDVTRLIAPSATKEVKPTRKPSLHEEIKNKIYDMGVWQGWIAEKEYRLNGERLDVAWIKRGVESAKPRIVFEVHIEGNPKSALANLKDANDKWNSEPIIVTKKELVPKINELLRGTFHEIIDNLKILTLEDLEKMYSSKKELNELKKKSGFELI